MTSEASLRKLRFWQRFGRPGDRQRLDSGAGATHLGLVMSVAETIRQKLTAALAPERLEIIDESDQHAGHAGAREGGESHFRLLIVAGAFAGKSRVERQRLVYGLLADEMRERVHALALTTQTPEESRSA